MEVGRALSASSSRGEEGEKARRCSVVQVVPWVDVGGVGPLLDPRRTGARPTETYPGGISGVATLRARSIAERNACPIGSTSSKIVQPPTSTLGSSVIP